MTLALLFPTVLAASTGHAAAPREVQISGTWTSRGGGRGAWWLQSAAP